MTTTDALSISSLLTPGRIRVGLEAGSKAEAINAMVDLLSEAAEVSDLEQLRADVFEREAVLSTGVGNGLALPHARTAAVAETLLAFAVLGKPVDYKSFDGKKVSLILLLVGPENDRVAHVRLLGRLSRLMNDAAFRDRLLEASSGEAIFGMFQQAEEAYG